MTTIFSFFKSYKYAFFVSISLSFIIWFLVYLFLPLETNTLSFKTIGYVGASVLCFVLGYSLFNFEIKPVFITSERLNYFIVFSILAVLGLTFRYLDLFQCRGLSLTNTYGENKFQDFKMASKTALPITLLGTLRVFSSVPLLLLIIKKSKNYKYWCVALFLITLSAIEIFVFGTRKPFFHIIILVVLSMFYSYKTSTFNLKKGLFFGSITLVVLSVFSYYILNKRIVSSPNRTNLVQVVHSRYNDFVKIQDAKIKQFEAQPNSFNTKAQIMLFHTGQYVVHGFYEMNYIIASNFPKAKGVYSFKPIFKLLNRINITNVNLATQKNHPRDYVYTTFFGSLFIDFGWFALIPIFLFGCFQKIIFKLSKFNLVAKLFFIFLLTVNLSMTVFNLLSGSGLYLALVLAVLSCVSLKKSGNSQTLHTSF